MSNMYTKHNVMIPNKHKCNLESNQTEIQACLPQVLETQGTFKYKSRVTMDTDKYLLCL